MSERIPKLILIDILDAISNILEFTEEMNFEMFENDKKTVAAVERYFEIIGEATRQLPDSFMIKHSQVEWHKMIAFRNVLIHEYFRVEKRIEWNIIKNTLPHLKREIASIHLPE